jgi:hypothetical protein
LLSKAGSPGLRKKPISVWDKIMEDRIKEETEKHERELQKRKTVIKMA